MSALDYYLDLDFEESNSDDSGDDYQPPVEASSEDEELDFVSTTLDSSVPTDDTMDSNAPLARWVAGRAPAARNAPGTSQFKWRKRENVPQCYGFAGQPGVKADHLTSNSSALEIFSVFFTPELWSLMEEETNKYAGQSPRRPSAHMKMWTDTNVEELQHFVGLRLLMGVHWVPDQQLYWSQNEVYRVPLFPDTMPRDRFNDLRKYLHFSDNATLDQTDRLAKLRPFIKLLENQYRTVFKPTQNISVDESLWAYHGRHHARQYNPSKRARSGFKVYKLCASDGPAAGYTCAFKVYMGQDASIIPASTKIVMDLLAFTGLLDVGYKVFTDSWYTSPSLFHELQSRKTMACGTVRQTRKYMPRDDMALVTRKKGDMDFRSSKTGMLCQAWKDKAKPVSKGSIFFCLLIYNFYIIFNYFDSTKKDIHVTYFTGDSSFYLPHLEDGAHHHPPRDSERVRPDEAVCHC